MAVRKEALEISASIIPFPIGTRPETARLLLDARKYGVTERIDPRDRLMLDRYFGTRATLGDIGIAGGISDCEAQIRLRKALVRIVSLLPDEVRDTHTQEATLLKTKRPGPKRNLFLTQAPFPIDIRIIAYGKDQTQKTDLEKDSERPLLFFTSSEYLLRTYRPPDICSQDSGEDLRPMSKRILSLVAQGFSYEEIALQIRKGVSTVRHFLEKDSLRPAINVSNVHEALVVAIEKGLLDLNELSSGLNLSDRAVNGLSPREVDILLLDTIGNLDNRMSKAAQQLGITVAGLRGRRLKIYRKLGVINRAQASVFVLAFVKKAKGEGKYPVVDKLNNGREFSEYKTDTAPIDIQYVIEELDRTGLTAFDKEAFLAHYLWLADDGHYGLIRKYLKGIDRVHIGLLLERVISGGNDPRYTMPLADIYQKFFAPIELSRSILYQHRGEKTLERFRALVAVSRRKLPLVRLERAKISTKTAVSKETRRVLNQSRLPKEAVIFDESLVV